ncbi:MAG: hypothetical protein AAF203_02330 [Pseudomonadota bacterium]
MMSRWSNKALLLLVFCCSVTVTSQAASLCRQIFSKPKVASITAVNIFVNPERIITHFLPSTDDPAQYRDFNDMAFDQSLPPHFVTGDGTLTLPFIKVDSRPESPLTKKIVDFENKITLANREWKIKKSEAVIRWLHKELLGFMPPVIDQPKHPFFVSESLTPEVESAFIEAGMHPPGEGAVATKEQHPLRGLDEFIDPNIGSFCFHKGLVASLILRRANIPHRVLSASIKDRDEAQADTPWGGHFVIELADGRILDPTKQVLAPIEKENVPDGWIGYDDYLLWTHQLHYYLPLSTGT